MTMRLTSRDRLALTLTSSVVGMLLLAHALGLIPDIEHLTLLGRVRQCESVALASSAFLAHDDLGGLSMLLENVVQRDRQLSSAGVRNATGSLMVEIGDHGSHWQSTSDGRSTPEQIWVPIYSQGAKPWGAVEFRFAPLRDAGIGGQLTSPLVQLVAFVAAAGFCAFSNILRMALPA